MKRIFTAATAAAVAVFGTAATAVPVTPTSLFDSVTVFQTVNIEDDSGLLNDANWFTFYATAGSNVDIDINRLEAAPDLFAELYFGDVTGLDFGGLNADNGAGNADPPLAFLDSEDDTEDDAFGGPFGDPRFTFTAGSTGIYSIAVTTLNLPGIGANFEITGTGIAAVPLPAAGFLLFGAVAGLAAFRRRS